MTDNNQQSSLADGHHVITPNAENRYEVTEADVPLHCPMDGMSLWNSHPRVYLPVESEGECKCPYCGAVFVLKSES